MTNLYIVIDGVVQPMPFHNWQDAYDEIERIRSQRTVYTYKIIYEDSLEFKNAQSTGISFNGISFKTWIIILLLLMLLL